jgi:alpha-L-arabinofuranosidase
MNTTATKWILSPYLICLFILSAGVANAQTTNKLIIYPDSVIKANSPLMTGACIEDVNHEIYGGIYSQLIFGESFQELPMNINKAVNPDFAGLSGSLSCKAPRDVLKDESEIRSWQPVRKGTSTGAFSIDSIHPFVGKQSQVMGFISGRGVIGIENRGLNREGLSLVGKKIYEGAIVVKAGAQTQLFITLENEDGSITYASAIINVDHKNWTKYNFSLTPVLSASHARLTVSLHKPGTVDLGYVFLQPGCWGRFKNLPLRKDVVAGLMKQHLTVLRYGGSMVNAKAYRWKNMIGPRYLRAPYKGTWYPFSTNGFGIIDFLDLCEAAGFTAIPTLNSDETPADMADFIEYVNGGVNTAWGKRRAADGHPLPYNLKYIELGNEQFNNQKLTDQFKLLADAIWAKDPAMQIVFCISDDTREDVSGDITLLKQTIDHCREKGHQAWFDVHIFNDNEKEPDLKDLEFAETQFKSIAPDNNFRICVFEENADNHRIRRGLAHANAINRLQRLKYDIPIVCAANGLQVDHQNDNGWDQGLLFFNQSKVWGESSFYVTQMNADNYQPQVIKSNFISKTDTLDVTACKSADGKTIVVKVVNYTAKAVNVQVILNNYAGVFKTDSAEVLEGDGLDDRNTAVEPYKIVPLPKQANGKGCNFSFGAYSFTVLKFTE